MSASRVAQPTYQNIPDDLTETDTWVLYKLELRHKVPYTLRGSRASTTDSRDWSPFSDVRDIFRRFPDRYSGLGYVFTKKSGLVGIDMDDCLDRDGNPKPWVRGLVERFGDTYIESSPSGHGLKIWARGSLPANVRGVRVGDGQIEMYDHNQYFTVTGVAFRGAPLQVEDHAQDLKELYDQLTAPKLKQKWPLMPLDGGRIPYGQQHNTLASIVGTLRARRVCEAAIEACLQIINARQCERPGPPENITRLVRSSRGWGPR